MTHRTHLLIFIVASAVIGTPAQADVDVKTGMWESTIEIEISGVPMKIPPQTTRQCITKKDLVPNNLQPGQDCEIKEQKIDGSEVTWKMVCNSSGMTTTADATITYSGDTYQGTMTLQIQSGPTPMGMTYRMSGHRVGPCDK